MPSASFLFLLFFISEIYFWKYSRNWTKIYREFLLDGRHLETKGQPWGPPTGQGRPPAGAPLGPRVGPAPTPGGSPWPPPTPINSLLPQKRRGSHYFPEKSSRRAVISNPSLGVILKQFPAPCRRGDRSRRALHCHAFLRDDL